MFIFGEDLPTHIVPPAVAIIGATLALIVVYGAKIEPIEKVLEDIDWKTLIFLLCMFCRVEAFTKTGVIQSLSLSFFTWFGVDLLLVALMVLVVVGFGSSLLANIPLVAAMILMLKGYFVLAQLVSEEALGAGAGRTVVPRDEVIIMDAYECNRQMGREEKYK